MGNLNSLCFLDELIKKHPINKIVLDDASHWWSHQILAFEKLFSTVEQGGIYVVEDIHTSFSPLSQRPLNDHGYADCYEDAYSYFSRLAYLVSGMGNKHSFFEKSPPTPMQIALAKEIDSISFYRETLLIIKK